MESTREQIIGEITALKMLLRDTDYEVTKYAEGLTDCTTQAEIEAYRESFLAQYGEIIDNRKAWRNKIRELEEALDAIEDEIEAEPEPEKAAPVDDAPDEDQPDNSPAPEDNGEESEDEIAEDAPAEDETEE